MLPNPLFWNVHMYGIMMALGIVAVFAVLYLYGKKVDLNLKFLDFCFYNGVFAIACGLGSAVLFQAIYNYIDNPAAGFRLDGSGGMTFIGGLIGGVAVFVGVYWLWRLYHYRKQLEPAGYITDLLPVAACCITVAHGFGRLGCFFAGCCYGKETDSWLGVKFPQLPHKVYPTQLYEAIFLFLLFGICSYLTLSKKQKYVMPLYLVCYGVFRFAIEFLRGDQRGQFVTGLSPSQFWSVCIVLFGVGLFFVLRAIYAKRERKETAA